MCKNAVMVILLIYRLLILSCRGNDEEIDLRRETASVKLNNTQVATVGEYCKINDKHLYKRNQSQDPAVRNRAGSRGYNNLSDRNHSLKNEELLNKRRKTLRDVEKTGVTPGAEVTPGTEVTPETRVTGPNRGMKTLPTISKLIKMDDLLSRAGHDLLLDEGVSTSSAIVPDIIIQGDEVEEGMGTNDSKDGVIIKIMSNDHRNVNENKAVTKVVSGSQRSKESSRSEMVEMNSIVTDTKFLTPPTDGETCNLIKDQTEAVILPVTSDNDMVLEIDNGGSSNIIQLRDNIEMNVSRDRTGMNRNIGEPPNVINQNAFQDDEEYEHSIASHVTARDVTLQVTNNDDIIADLEAF